MKLTHSLLIAVLLLNAPARGIAQGNPHDRRELYQRCTSSMRTDPLAAYEICKEYLRRYPDDDQRFTQFAGQWVAAYERILPYLTYLRTITSPNASASWFVYEPDLTIETPQITESDEYNPVEIARIFRDEREAAMLRRAEAVYPSVDNMVTRVSGDPAFFAQFAPLENEPLWWNGRFNGVKAVYVITARAVRYYYDISQNFRTNPQRRVPGWGRWRTRLKYVATISHHDEYSRSGESFRDVYVADLNLEWSQVCGGLCGAGYRRNKVVVLDRSGNVIAMFLDAPQNRSGWIS